MWAPFLLINESGLLSWLGSSPNSLEHPKQFGILPLVLSRLGILQSLELCVEWLSHIQFIGGIGWLGFNFEIITKPPPWKSFSLFLIYWGWNSPSIFIQKFVHLLIRREKNQFPMWEKSSLLFVSNSNPNSIRIRFYLKSKFNFIPLDNFP